MTNLHLAVKGEYFDQMKAGEKKEEYRLVNKYWCRRLTHDHNLKLPRKFDRLIITRGYPKREDESRRIDIPYGGYEIKEIIHPHFGPEPVKVFAIKVSFGGKR
ncbi:TPA: ASCH domain-containing protein [Cronobacter sakazakii]|uniref:RNA-binding protein n=1 Tax=Cronobacter malonaticus TaxID=413503 RepID=UPI000CFEAB5B|nr:RNA-binding protein [Cronobacter malonaticus]HDK7322713.1 ASCH domain-containing protein [Cronobacter sakazakii]